MSLVILGPVESSYWEQQSRQPRTRAEGHQGHYDRGGSETIVAAIERNKRSITHPEIFRLLFAMGAIGFAGRE